MTTGGKDSTPPAPGRLGWLRAASDRVPTRWFAGIATGVFLVATAAFGGLAAASEPEVTTLEPGDEHRNDQLAITVERAVLLDEFPEAGVSVEDGERVLAVQVAVENTWTQPLAPTDLADALNVDELAGAPADSVARYDDATLNPRLQPGVPAELVLTWAVDADAFEDESDLHITLNDLTLYTGSFIADGQWWTDPVPAATVTVAVEDLGAGA